MSQQPLPLTRATLADRMRSYFLAHPDCWIDARELVTIGGFGGWRTRVSDCRLQYGMDIENRTERHQGYTVSFYRYRRGPAGTQEHVA